MKKENVGETMVYGDFLMNVQQFSKWLHRSDPNMNLPIALGSLLGLLNSLLQIKKKKKKAKKLLSSTAIIFIDHL